MGLFGEQRCGGDVNESSCESAFSRGAEDGTIVSRVDALLELWEGRKCERFF